ncbi:MAG: hypothetical protein ACK4NW_07970 [Roseinatronobacter sp.]
MPKHVIDHPKALPTAMLARFVKIERAKQPHASVKTLVARPLDRANDRTPAFSRISRGIST